jgi:hypothetical protein
MPTRVESNSLADEIAATVPNGHWLREKPTMTTIAALLLTGLTGQTMTPPAAPDPPDKQIAAAVQAAPEELRAEATVLGYDQQGVLVPLRKGANELVCLADDPRDQSFSVACYHKDLEPFMARGRELRAKGITGKERDQTRWKEIEAGTLFMSREPRTLYVLSGKGFDASAGMVIDPYRRWVIYCPFATAASTGLSTMPVPGGPWLMFPGEAGAHIMISPPRDEK